MIMSTIQIFVEAIMLRERNWFAIYYDFVILSATSTATVTCFEMAMYWGKSQLFDSTFLWVGETDQLTFQNLL